MTRRARTKDRKERARNRRLRGYEVPLRVTQWLTGLGLIYCAFAVLSLPFLRLKKRTTGELGISDRFEPPLYVILAVLIILFVWVQFCLANLRTFAVPGLRSGARAGLWFFVPFINCVKPFSVLSELWRASDPEVEEEDPAWERGRPPTHGLAAWTLALLGLTSALLARLDVLIPAAAQRLQLIVVSRALLVSALLLGIVYAWGVVKRQDAKRRRALIPKGLKIAVHDPVQLESPESSVRSDDLG